jgi:hypothetical protein
MGSGCDASKVLLIVLKVNPGEGEKKAGSHFAKYGPEGFFCASGISASDF